MPMDIRRKFEMHPEFFLVGEIEGHAVASLMAGDEGHRGWLNYLAVDPELQRQGLGRHMVAAAEAKLHELGCPKMNLQVRTTNHSVIEFYTRLGCAVEEFVSFGERL